MAPPLHSRDAVTALAMTEIVTSINMRGFPPTVREISQSLGWKSSQQGKRTVDRLVEQGLITITAGSHRSIRVTEAGMRAALEVM